MLVEGVEGNFYGTTPSGRTNGNHGTVFKITPAGAFTTLWQFSLGVDGGEPAAGLIQGSDSNFYGTAQLGGTNNRGTIFKITSAGVLTTLYQFGGTNGSFPHGGIVLGNDGNFYGTTYQGGSGAFGTVYRITPAGAFTPLHNFSTPAGGRFALAGLALGSDGNFYGATTSGGSSGNGTLYMITAAGTFATFDVFTNIFWGTQPRAGLAQDADGNFYGTANHDGTNDFGTVFKLLISLSPPANQISAIKRASTNIVLSVSSVDGETYQLQYRDSLIAASNWLNAPFNPITSIGGPLTLTNFGGATATEKQRFYRVRITP